MKVEGFLWYEKEPSAQPKSLAQVWEEAPNAAWTVRTWGGERSGIHFPTRIVATLTDGQVQTARVAEGDFLTLEKTNAQLVRHETQVKEWEIRQVHGLPVKTWERLGHGKGWKWSVLDNTLRQLVPMAPGPEDKVAAVWSSLLPIIVGQKVLISGPAGSQKSNLLAEVMSAVSSQFRRVLLLTERSSETPLNEKTEAAPNYPVVPEGMEVWAIPMDIGIPEDQVRLTRFAVSAICRSAFFRPTVVGWDSATAYAWAVNQLATPETGQRTLSGGLSPRSVQEVSQIFGTARDPLACSGNITFLAIHMLVKGDTMSESLLRQLRARADTYVSLRRADRHAPWLPISLESGDTLHRQIERVVDPKSAQALWDMQAAAANWAPEQWNHFAKAASVLEPKTIWQNWPSIIKGQMPKLAETPEEIAAREAELKAAVLSCSALFPQTT